LKTLSEVKKEHITKFGLEPIIIGVASKETLIQEILLSIIQNIPYDEHRVLSEAIRKKLDKKQGILDKIYCNNGYKRSK